MPGLEKLLSGRTLVDRYRIGEVIGRGGFATVFRAMDERLRRPVAVKVLTINASDAATRQQLGERFRREARAVARLQQHPNVVTVHDFGTDTSLGLDFLVMEYLEGEDLARYLERESKPPLELALQIIGDTAEGLGVGHRAGLIHRDVKPGNIYLAAPHGDEPFRVCLLDFGIARLAAEESAATVTMVGGGALSPAYASPEQLRGEMNLTAASDVFSLGVVGYQLLTGEKLFDRNRTEGPVPPEAISRLHELAPPGSEEVIAILERALATNPTDRFPDAQGMGAALETVSAAIERTVIAPVPSASPVVVAAPVAATHTVALPEPVPVTAPPPEDRTLMQPAPAPVSPAPRPYVTPTPRPAPVSRPAPAPAARPAAGRSRSAFWVLGLLLLGGAGFGMWALGGDGPEPPASETAPIVGGTPATVPSAGQQPQVPQGGDPGVAIEVPIPGQTQPAGSSPAPMPGSPQPGTAPVYPPAGQPAGTPPPQNIPYPTPLPAQPTVPATPPFVDPQLSQPPPTVQQPQPRVEPPPPPREPDTVLALPRIPEPRLAVPNVQIRPIPLPRPVIPRPVRPDTFMLRSP